MLVVISDLHLGDRSATVNIPPRAFALFLDHVLDLAEHAGAKEVTLLFLGDIFDLLRTEYWFYPPPGARSLGDPAHVPAPGAGDPFPFPLAHRPWGDPRVLDDGSPQVLTPECQARALEITERIAEVCKPQLDILSGRSRDLAEIEDTALRARVSQKLSDRRGITFRRYYLPGNHDRLARVLDPVHAAICAALGAEPAPEDPTGLVNVQELRVIARHGHEWDGWNFDARGAGKLDPAAAEFRLTPVGDVITTEALARLPYRVWQELQAKFPGEAWIDAVYEHLCGVEDVRPLGAVLRWVASAGGRVHRIAFTDPARQLGAVLEVVDKVAPELVRDMLRLPYTRAWLRRRRWFRAGWLEAMRLRGIGLALRLFTPTQLGPLLEWGPVARWLAAPDESLALRAAEMLAAHPADYAVCGHTHDFRHVPLCDPPAGGAVQVYFNSGTWRPRTYETLDRSGFRSVKEMTYLVFHAGKRPAAYETWNGVMLK